MLNSNFVFLGLGIQILGIASYLIDTLKGKVQPNKVSFLLWSIAPLVAFAAEVKQGVGIQSLMTFSVGFSPLLIFLASFVNKKAQWKLGAFDFTCGALAILGLIFWYITKVGNVAIVFSIVADSLASLPTFVKAWRHPESENPYAYLASTINAAITLLTIRNWNFETYAFPIYMVVLNFLIFLPIKFRFGRKTIIIKDSSN